MTSDDDLMQLFRARWSRFEKQRAVPERVKPPAIEWAHLVQLNVRVPTEVKKSIEKSATARGETLAQFIAWTCTRHEREDA